MLEGLVYVGLDDDQNVGHAGGGGGSLWEVSVNNLEIGIKAIQLLREGGNSVSCTTGSPFQV